jgi:hypothetical protein
MAELSTLNQFFGYPYLLERIPGDEHDNFNKMIRTVFRECFNALSLDFDKDEIAEGLTLNGVHIFAEKDLLDIQGRRSLSIDLISDSKQPSRRQLMLISDPLWQNSVYGLRSEADFPNGLLILSDIFNSSIRNNVVKKSGYADFEVMGATLSHWGNVAFKPWAEMMIHALDGHNPFSEIYEIPERK